LVPRKDAWDLAPLAASSRGGLASCGGMRREPDVRQEFVERAGTLMRDFAAMDGVRIKTLIGRRQPVPVCDQLPECRVSADSVQTAGKSIGVNSKL